MNSCRIYEEDSKTHYKVINERRGRQPHNHGKPYNSMTDKGKPRVSDGRRTLGEVLLPTSCVLDVGSQVRDFLEVSQMRFQMCRQKEKWSFLLILFLV